MDFSHVVWDVPPYRSSIDLAYVPIYALQSWVSSAFNRYVNEVLDVWRYTSRCAVIDLDRITVSVELCDFSPTPIHFGGHCARFLYVVFEIANFRFWTFRNDRFPFLPVPLVVPEAIVPLRAFAAPFHIVVNSLPSIATDLDSTGERFE